MLSYEEDFLSHQVDLSILGGETGIYGVFWSIFPLNINHSSPPRMEKALEGFPNAL